MTLRGWLIMLGVACAALTLILIFYRENRFQGKPATVIEVLDCQNMVLKAPAFERAIRVNLNAVSCPDITQPFGVQARNFTYDRVMNKDVLYKIDSLSKDAKVLYVEIGLPGLSTFLTNAASLSEELIKAGLATSRDPDLQDLQNQAKAAGRGMWTGAPK